MLINGLVVSGLRVVSGLWVVSDFATLNYEGAPIKRLRTLRVAVKLRSLSLSLSQRNLYLKSPLVHSGTNNLIA